MHQPAPGTFPPLLRMTSTQEVTAIAIVGVLSICGLAVAMKAYDKWKSSQTSMADSSAWEVSIDAGQSGADLEAGGSKKLKSVKKKNPLPEKDESLDEYNDYQAQNADFQATQSADDPMTLSGDRRTNYDHFNKAQLGLPVDLSQVSQRKWQKSGRQHKKEQKEEAKAAKEESKAAEAKQKAKQKKRDNRLKEGEKQARKEAKKLSRGHRNPMNASQDGYVSADMLQ